MPRPNQKAKKKASSKKIKNSRYKKKTGTTPINWKNRIIKCGAVLVFLFLISFALFILLVFAGAFGRIPTKQDLSSIRNPVASEVLASDGSLLGRYYIENRTNASIDEIPAHLIDALVATEDARFFKHKGIDPRAYVRVFVKSILLRDKSAGGGSTISQQLAKNLFPRRKSGALHILINKTRETIIALRLEKIYSKEDILVMYLNTVPFGENVYGIETAAERYFNTIPGQLSTTESATLIGMLKANTSYNPRLFPEHSMHRRNVVLSQMIKYGFLDEEIGIQMCESPLGLQYNKITYETGPAPYYREMLRQELGDWCEKTVKEDGTNYNLYTDGLKFYTTIDQDLQLYAEQAVIQHMSKLQEIFNRHWAGREPWGKNYRVVDDAMKRSDRYRSLKQSGLPDKEIRDRFEEEKEMALFGYNGEVHKNISPLDSIKYYLKLLNTGFLAMDPDDGAIKAWIGGIEFRYFKYDHVKSNRQIGSTFKPFVYLAALENGIDPFDYYANEKVTYHDYNDWTPANSDGEYGGYFSFEGALVHSVNTVSVQMIMQTGIDGVIELAHNMGITSPLPEVPSLALGAADLSLIEMVTAYSCLVNGGIPVHPYHVIRIEDSEGNILEEFVPEESDEPVFTGQNGMMMIHMLESVVDSGTARSLRNIFGLKGSIAGKTGTTQNNADGWFIGCTPELVAGVWVGAQDPAIHFRNTDLGQGAFMALPIWARFMQKVYKDPQFNYILASHFEEPTDYILAMADLPFYKENKKEAKQAIRAMEVSLKENKTEMTSKKSKKPKIKEPFFKRVKRFFKKKDG